MAAASPLVRIVDASLGADAQVRLVLSNVSRPDRLRSAWSSAGATLERIGDRVHATTTVEALARAAGRSLERPEFADLDRRLRESVAAWGGPAPTVPARDAVLRCDRRPLVAGIVNVTPDSFSDGGRRYPDGHPRAAVEHGLQLLEQGADLLDVGGESTRPGAEPVDEGEELARTVPVVERLAAAGALVSIDTRKAAVARAALRAGAAIVNDVSCASDDALLAAAAEGRAAYVLVHSRGTPQDMQRRTDYDDVVAEVFEALAAGLERCEAAGIERTRIVVDPGIGFAKTAAQNLELLRALRQLRGLGRPVLVGVSRKSFLGAPLGGGGPQERVAGTLACEALAVAAGAALVRTHDVRASLQSARAAHAVVSGTTQWPPAREARQA